MLFLLFQLGNDRYAVEANRVLEVLPLLEIKRLPHAPKGVVGIFNLRGKPVPALDLNELTFGRPARERLTTRILLIQHTDSQGRQRLLGLIAEYVTQTLRKAPAEFMDPGVELNSAPFLGPVLMHDPEPIQWLHTDRLVSEPILQLLCSEPLLAGQFEMPEPGEHQTAPPHAQVPSENRLGL